MRSRFRRPQERVFRVDLTIHQLDSIPLIHRLLYVAWRARRATPPDGRTPSHPVEHGNKVRWNTSITFSVAIPSDPADPTVLQPTPLLLQLRSERRARWVGHTSYQPEGRVELDLSEVAAVGSISRNYLVQDSLLNTTLKVSARLTHQAGDKIFRTRALPHNPNSTISPRNPASLPGSAAVTPNSSTAEAAPHLAAVATPNPDDDTPPPDSDLLSVPPRLPSLPDMVAPPPPPPPTSHRAPVLPAFPDTSPFAIPTPATAPPGPPLQALATGPPPTTLPLQFASSAPPPVGPLSRPMPCPTAPLSGPLDSNDMTAVSVWDAPNTPAFVLQTSIPDPDVVQHHVYETMFQLRLRDGWPGHIVKSRVDADAAVDHAYAAVCAADGICVAAPTTDFLAKRERDMEGGRRKAGGGGGGGGGGKRSPPRLSPIPRSEVESFGFEHQPTPVTQMLLTRRRSGRSPSLMARSNSLGDLGSLTLG